VLFALFVNVTPLGNPDGTQPAKPALLIVLTGSPVVVTVKLPAAPTVNVAWFALMIAGASLPGWSTVKVKVCVAFGEAALEAVRQSV
jgi:hypothetical protein